MLHAAQELITQGWRSRSWDWPPERCEMRIQKLGLQIKPVLIEIVNNESNPRFKEY